MAWYKLQKLMMINVNAEFITSLMKRISPGIKELDEYDSKKLKQIKHAITTILAVIINCKTKEANLLFIMLALLLSIISSKIDNTGYNGTGIIVGVNILATSNPLEYMLLPLMYKLQKIDVSRVTVNSRGRKDRLSFRIFNNGAIPIVISTSIVQLLSIFIPIPTYIIPVLKGVLTFIINKVQTNSVNIDDIDKMLRDNAIAIVDNEDKRNKDIINDILSYTSNVSGVIMGLISAMNAEEISNMLILASVIEDIVNRLKSNKKYTRILK